MDTSLFDKVASALRQNRDRYVDRSMETADEIARAGRGVAFSREELNQMIDGAINAVLEAAEGKSSDVRKFYCETLIPAVVEQGAPLTVAAGATGEVHMLMAADLVQRLPDHADEILKFYTLFVREFIIDIIDAGFTAEIARRAKTTAK